MAKSKNVFTSEDDALLEQLGIEVEVKKAVKYTKEQERVIAGFEEIQRFVEKNGKCPKHGEDRDIFERMYAVRLDRLRALSKFHKLLQPMDYQGLLVNHEGVADESIDQMDDDALLAALGIEVQVSELQELKHIRPSKERRSASEIGSRQKCADFNQFKALFDQVRSELKAEIRKLVKCNDKADVKLEDLFVVKGQTALVAHMSDPFKDEEGRDDCRLRVIFDNGTESNMLRRSFQKRLWEDETARRITTPSDIGPLFNGQVFDEDHNSGTLYVLRSKSPVPYIAENRSLIHKIGFTTGSVKKRIADAVNQATYLLAEVEIVASYALYNVSANKLENLLHKLFSPAQLDIEINDRFGKPFKPREWFLVPLDVVKGAVEKLRDGTITNYQYDPNEARLVKN